MSHTEPPHSDVLLAVYLSRVQAEDARRHTHHGNLVATSRAAGDLNRWSLAGFPPPDSSTTSKETDMSAPAGEDPAVLEIKELIDFRVDGRNLWDSLKDIRALADQAVLQEALTKLNATLTRLSQQLEQQPLPGRRAPMSGRVSRAQMRRWKRAES